MRKGEPYSVSDRIWKANNGAKLANYSNILVIFAEKKSDLSQFGQKVFFECLISAHTEGTRSFFIITRRRRGLAK